MESNRYDERSIELSYEQVLLSHLNRISMLSAQIMGIQNAAGGTIINWTENDKTDSFIYAVQVLESLIPDEFRDKEYTNKLKNLDKIRSEVIKKNERLLKENSENEDVDPEDFGRGAFYMKRFRLAINLLARKGLLFDRKMRSRLPGKKKDDQGTVEVFD